MKTERHNVVSVYLSDEEMSIIKKLAEWEGRSKTQELRILAMQRVKMLEKEDSNELKE